MAITPTFLQTVGHDLLCSLPPMPALPPLPVLGGHSLQGKVSGQGGHQAACYPSLAASCSSFLPISTHSFCGSSTAFFLGTHPPSLGPSDSIPHSGARRITQLRQLVYSNCGLSDWFRNGHITKAHPIRANPRNFVFVSRRKIPSSTGTSLCKDNVSLELLPTGRKIAGE